jgi:sulfate adenylyltransferase subunit 2
MTSTILAKAEAAAHDATRHEAHLDALEAQSVFILREAYARIENLAMLWSFGKDSNVLIWLAKKAFFGKVPFPVVNIDTGNKFDEAYAFRDRYTKEWGVDLIVGMAPTLEFTDPSLPEDARRGQRKSLGLRKILDERKYGGLIAGIRRDEEGTRAKERVFSPRRADGAWDPANQPPEFWDQFNDEFAPGAHIRVHPLLAWTESDIWRYIRREAIPVVDLYFSKDGKRYRSIGDKDITFPIDSPASTLDEIILELETTNVSERSGRAMDKSSEDAFERLRVDGYL